MTELAGRKQIHDPLLDLAMANIKARADDTTFVDPANEIYDDLASTMVIDDFKFANIAVFHHLLQKLDDHLGGRPDEHLAFAAFFSIEYATQTVV
mmetsp:Transcript_53499/g.88829  ORF Transcript_53499/g.88829 Transcript_53499/m.88829 type:complete len:95 (+) Transcript_53499:192-476(+)|eukprot:CAMPEP_0119308738 /NCGR_PEP_ID=MMETSP1333-20130426/12477_1 /TAXON_ID=418940 /ORGANISM="Scyphosphaera apsteinii, Strain RCC1455" /LENGTH=94 /DNA_ID=CAMNT_0007312577 /DNA_START=297 /DNA_END=581 /DNA_ORIENTATION=+